MDAYKGKSFRRNRYGLSIWEDVVKDAWERKGEIMITGSYNTYPKNEIIFT